MNKKNWLATLIFLTILNPCLYSQVRSLADIYKTGKILLDTDGDSWPDRIATRIILPPQPSAWEIAAAGDIAARFNFESLALDFTLVRLTTDSPFSQKDVLSIQIGVNLLEEDKLLPHQGIVSLDTSQNPPYLFLTGGSPESVLKTARAFFLRWPYLWEIWGREEGITYGQVEKDIRHFLKEEKLDEYNLSIQSAFYEFPSPDIPYQSLKRLNFEEGEIKELIVSLSFKNQQESQNAIQGFQQLLSDHRRGLRSGVLSYPGCAELRLIISNPKTSTEIRLPRLSYPKRILTPSYKTPLKVKPKGKDFDLTSFFSTSGIYADSNSDGIQDSLESCLVIPQTFTHPEISLLSSRFVLDTAGASFPIIFLDKDIDEPASLISPVVIDEKNILAEKLIKTGKLSKPSLTPGHGLIQVVPEAFNQSNALVLLGDEKGLKKTLNYLSRIFPFFKDYQEGNPSLKDIPREGKVLSTGGKGVAEAYFYQQLIEWLEEYRDFHFDSVELSLILPEKNSSFAAYVQKTLKNSLRADKIQVDCFSMEDPRLLFKKEKEFEWEGRKALSMIEENLERLKKVKGSLSISLGLSESPQIRARIKNEIEEIMNKNNIKFSSIEVLSSYKQGFFWLKEKILPQLEKIKPEKILIRVSRAQQDLTPPKRFYTEPLRWLQELYPVDEFLAASLNLPLKNIEFELKDYAKPVYEITAYHKNGEPVFKESFSPYTAKRLYLDVLPEWGEVELTTGWLAVKSDEELILNFRIKSDLENFWGFYQEEILEKVHQHVLQTTGREPSFSKQPYFKRLMIELWASEPDFTTGLDEEIISSLEALHDEIYFDTLDFLRGITDISLKEEESQEDTSRYSAPGNVFPVIHPSREGENPSVKVTFEDRQAKEPRLEIKWKIKQRKESQKKFTFPGLSLSKTLIPSLEYNGLKERIARIDLHLEIEKEKDYLLFVESLHTLKALVSRGTLPPPFQWPGLDSLCLRLKNKEKEMEKEVIFPVGSDHGSGEKSRLALKRLNKLKVPTDSIISHKLCLELYEKLKRSDVLRGYIAGRSFEKREIPVLEAFTPMNQYVSIPRLITVKPTLYSSGRQHANEVSSTNYLLKLAELMVEDTSYQDFLKKVNVVLHPMENPDGTELAYKLQQLTPFHSLHAGRYSSLGLEIGHQVQAKNPLLPEARVRKQLNEKWLPDIYLNLHGYPSHEWVQQFSGYSPYLFRDYWIPRGWFVYFRSLRLPLYEKWKSAGEDLKKIIIEEIKQDKEFHQSNQKFYNRYHRWAERWQPHLNYLEIQDGVNIYSRRRSSREARLTPRWKMTYVEETPELMDETARGGWLDFLCRQGLAYLKAHLKYLSCSDFIRIRIEEEYRNRIHIQLVRGRPGQCNTQ
ncbi:MAG: M14 family metallopeptidase [Acidobacteriota bacterium]